MLLDLKELIKKYNLHITGVVHIGAHFGEEHNLYEDLNIKDLHYFEPLSNNFRILSERLSGKNVYLYNVALGNESKEIEMFVETANQGQSSSILKPKKHLNQYPHITFNNSEIVKMERLDDFQLGECNFINIDVQGYELEVLKGGSKILENIDYIISEVNQDELYENCVFVEELDNFLVDYGFKRIETSWDGITWGDALYIKETK